MVSRGVVAACGTAAPGGGRGARAVAAAPGARAWLRVPTLVLGASAVLYQLPYFFVSAGTDFLRRVERLGLHDRRCVPVGGAACRGAALRRSPPFGSGGASE